MDTAVKNRNNNQSLSDEQSLSNEASQGRTMTETIAAVVGNPNSGKTTLFNGLTGNKQRIGNWPGVTVEKKEGALKTRNRSVRLVDLPGIYSLSASSEDEKVARDFLLSGEAKVVINIIDASNLERNLFLTTQLIEMKVPLFLVVNMMDVAEKKGLSINLEHLEKHLGIPVMGISAIKGDEIKRVKEKLDSVLENPVTCHERVRYPNEIEDVINRRAPAVEKIARGLGADPRWVVLKLLEGDEWVIDKTLRDGSLTRKDIDDETGKVESLLGDTADVLLADYKYGFIHGTVKDIVARKKDRRGFTEKADRVVMHRILGIPIFLAVMYLVFWVTISVGGAFIDFFDILFGAVFVDGFGLLLENMGSPGWLITLLAHGVGAGIQTVATFIPIIFMMFFMLSLLEDSGYMARAAFVMDRFMRWIGLPGKAFVPMLVGFGCTVPAIMATRTLESKKDRYMTVFMVPFMSCGARLPVYALFGAAFFGAAAGNIVFSIYMVGIVLAILTGLLLKNTLFKGEPSHFVMELPPYHAPRMRHIMYHTWMRLKVFMIRAGLVIVILVTVLGFLNSIGTDGSIGNEDSENSALSVVGKAITPVFEPMGVEEGNWPAAVAIFTGLFAKEAVVGTLNSLYNQMDASVAADSGGTEETTGRTTGTEEAEEAGAAMGTEEDAPAGTEETEEAEDEGFSLGAEVGAAFASVPEGLGGIFGGLADPFGTGVLAGGDQAAVAEEVEAEERVFSAMTTYFSRGKNQAYAYLLFVLIYFPCVAALGAAIREIGKGFGWLSVTYLTVLAWITATLYYQITVAHQAVWIIVPLLLLSVIYGVFRWMGRTRKA